MAPYAVWQATAVPMTFNEGLSVPSTSISDEPLAVFARALELHLQAQVAAAPSHGILTHTRPPIHAQMIETSSGLDVWPYIRLHTVSVLCARVRRSRERSS
jgi:hypothetical protein